MTVQKDINGKLILSDKQIDMTVQRIINKKAKHKTITFTTSINGKEVIVVKYHKLIDLDMLSPSSRRKITKRYILRAFEGSAVKTANGRTVTIKSTGGANKMHFQSKQNITFFIDDLIRNSVFFKSGPDYYDNRVIWLYYNSYFELNGVITRVLINFKEAGETLSFYDVNKIKEVDMSATSNR